MARRGSIDKDSHSIFCLFYFIIKGQRKSHPTNQVTLGNLARCYQTKKAILILLNGESVQLVPLVH
nr:MAG TPA: hypothetical protein [Caudoviricetes sp.]